MAGAGKAVVDVRFHRGGRGWPSNPYLFQGPGQVVLEADFVVLRGSSHRSFRFPRRAEHRLRKVDIVNARAEGEDVLFHAIEVDGSREVGFSAPDAATAQAIVAALPARWTPAFEVAYGEREAFHDRIDYWSPSTPVIWLLLAANVGIFALMWLQLHSSAAADLRTAIGRGSRADAIAHAVQLVKWGSNVGRLTLAGEWWRLVTAMFLHGSLLHLAFNMFALWQVGRLVERIFGSARFAALYLAAGVCGSVASVLWNPQVNSVGASGAVFGIIGGLLAFLRRKDSGVPPTVVADLRGSILPFLLFNLSAGFLYPHTDNAAHLGGLAGGWLAGHLLARSLHVPAHASR
ncbi:rhomboid family intramembrane serine protease [uncultured Massilia sp.]|uniref:rhomboid family intramembrane serine protease n=1 Tax=uncultured Massilia sp. TaxID=169973 RepID=UPI0025DEF0BA|nr:rhomboid family intramembrane serine protease [uncultured Massilia sp.]